MTHSISTSTRLLLVALLLVLTAITSRDSRTAALNAFHDPKIHGNAPGLLVPAIDGARHPELISDESAYSIMLRIMARRNTPNETRAARSYAKAILRYASQACESCTKELVPEEIVGRLLVVADEYASRIAELNQRAKVLHRTATTSPNMPFARGAIAAEKDQITRTYVQRLNGALGATYAKRVATFVGSHMKTKMQVVLHANPVTTTDDSIKVLR